jgi:DNA-binding response OmpR family regulator
VINLRLSLQLVEGNSHLRSLLGWHLQQVGYDVYSSGDFQHARQVFHRRQPTLVVLSTDTPGSDGIEYCRWLRQQHPQVMILILSARSNEADVVAGLRAGADDYLKKPFGMQEFMARVEVLVRRSRMCSPPAYLDYGVLKIDLVHRRIRCYGQLIELTPQEFSLLYVLAQAEGNPLSRAELLQRAWPDAIDNPRTVDTHVLSLRKKLEQDPQQPSLIQTIRNVGYRLYLEGLAQPSPQPTNPPAAPGPRLSTVVMPTAAEG